MVDDVNYVDVDKNEETVFTKFAAAQDDLLKSLGVPSGKRVLAAFAVSLVTGLVTGYVAGVLIDLAVTGVLLLTGSGFLALLVWIIGFVLTIAAAAKLGGITGAAVMNGSVDRAYESTKSAVTDTCNRVASWFGRKTVVAA